MILLEVEPALPGAVETNKAQVLTALQTMHAVGHYATVGELAAFLDNLLEELTDAGVPRGLTRVLLFYRTPRAIEEVQQRLVPGGTFLAFKAPACWQRLGARLPELRAWAREIEPGFDDLPAGV